MQQSARKDSRSCGGASESKPAKPFARSWHAKDRRPGGINLVVAQFVVTPDVRSKDLARLLTTTPAHVVVVIFDAAPSHDWATSGFRLSTCFDDAEQRDDVFNLFSESPFLRNQGAILCRKGRVTAAPLARLDHGGGAYEDFCLKTSADHMNPETAVAVGVMLPKPGLDFSDDFLLRVARRMKDNSVRFLAGVFKSDVAKLREAVPKWTPFLQLWWRDDKRFKTVAYPASIVFIGDAKDIGEL